MRTLRPLHLLAPGAAVLLVAALIAFWTAPGPPDELAARAATRGEPHEPQQAASPLASGDSADRQPSAWMSSDGSLRLAADGSLSTRAPSAPVERLTAAPAWSVNGRVLDQDDALVGGVTVQLFHGRKSFECVTDDQGRFAFDDLRPGRYRLLVEPESLPLHLLPPWRQQVAQRYDGRATGVLGTAFRLTTPAEHQVDLRVFEAGVVCGRLIDADGAPIADALTVIRGTSGVRETARTDADGRFSFDPVYPGDYVAFVNLPASLPEGGASAPLPQSFTLQPGASRELPAFVAASGGHVLSGRVLDPVGQPVAGLEVHCETQGDSATATHWTARTDADGRYSIGRVPSSALLLRVADTAPQADAQYLGPDEPLLLDATNAPFAMPVPDLTVQPRHPFILNGSVQLDPSWAATHGLDLSRARVEVHDVGTTEGRTLELQHASPWHRSPDEPGSEPAHFRWACATPHPSIVLRVTLRDADGQEHERRTLLDPTPDTTQSLVITFP
jgi:hypothetical protein